ncbi:hypothetical protein RND71_028001 [Anisodus tanguticus]|uniref:Uncharacterized protein n=1 Tax=Anisodus tanguticus TaxID=243964 RepID=A0AAE1RIW8_9SOLA|nr:hypothetical protein RND71_028001 [Anisodus tanguticus]
MTTKWRHGTKIRDFLMQLCSLKFKVLKDIFYEVKNKLETAIGVLRKEKIAIDPEDPAAVSEYAKVMKSVRQK